MPDSNNDIDALLGYLSICADRYSCHTLPSDVAVNYHSAVTALVAERDMLSVEVGGLRSAMKAQDDRERDAGERCGVNRDMSGCDWPDAVADEVIALKQRVSELESQQPAASDLREQMSAMMSWMTHVTDMIVIHGLNADHAKIELSRRIDRAIVAANKHGGGA